MLNFKDPDVDLSLIAPFDYSERDIAVLLKARPPELTIEEHLASIFSNNNKIRNDINKCRRDMRELYEQFEKNLAVLKETESRLISRCDHDLVSTYDHPGLPGDPIYKVCRICGVRLI